jgi:hypothetical protein
MSIVVRVFPCVVHLETTSDQQHSMCLKKNIDDNITIINHHIMHHESAALVPPSSTISSNCSSTNDTSASLLYNTISSGESRINTYGSISHVAYPRHHAEQDGFSPANTGSQDYRLVTWILVLIVSYATERCTFKIMVDRYGPFRLFAAEAVIGTYTLLLGLQILFALRQQRTDSSRMTSSIGFSSIFQLPPVDLGLIVLLDSLQILLVYICGSHVLPVLTVTLTQLTIPLVLFFTQLVHKHGACNFLHVYNLTSSSESGGSSSAHDAAANSSATEIDDQASIIRNTVDDAHNNYNAPLNNGVSVLSTTSCGGYTPQHVVGAAIIFFALILGVTPSILCIENLFSSAESQKQGNITSLMIQRGWNTILYTLSFIPASISQLLKESMLTTYRQPVDTVQLNFTLSAFKLFALGVLAPFFYPLQGLRSGVASSYRSRDMSSNFQNALLCTLGLLSEEVSQHGYAEPASCGIFSWLWIVGHVSSTMALTLSIQQVVMLCNSSISTSASGEQLQQQQVIVYQSLIGGLVLASMFLWFYTLWFNEVEEPWRIGQFNIVNTLHVTSFLLVVLGLELYHRNIIPGLTFETDYPEVEYYGAEEE